jgi:hypothetical protein
MNDLTLYAHLLNVRKPWRVTGVKLDLAKQQVQVQIECAHETWGCPTCGQRAHRHGYEERTRRHLDTCPCVTLIHARVLQAEDKIVHDLVHLVQKTNRAVDEVQRQEHAELKACGMGHVR